MRLFVFGNRMMDAGSVIDRPVREMNCMKRAFRLLCAALLLAPLPALAASTSVYRTPPDDPHAVTVQGVGDGRADDSAAIQAAIDAAAVGGHGGVVFLPEGRYRISRTIFLRSAVRVFGVGGIRPVIVLGDETPGFAAGVAAMISFTGEDQYASGGWRSRRRRACRSMPTCSMPVRARSIPRCRIWI